MKGVITLLKSLGFKKQPWNKCPQGFKEYNYPCYSHEEKNMWCELYLSDTLPYGWIVGAGIKGTGIGGGGFFYSLPDLQKILK